MGHFSPYTPNIDPSVLGKYQTPDLIGNFKKGMEIRQQMDQRRDERKLKTDMTAASQGLDPTTEQGMAQLAKRLYDQGHTAEAMEMHKLAIGIQKKAPTYITKESQGGLIGVNESDPTDAKPVMVNGQQAMPYEKPATERQEKFQLVKNKKGQMESVDVSTGLNKAGQPVDAWQEPDKPLGGAVMLGSYLRDWSKSKFDYEKAAKPYLALQGIVKSKAYGTGIGDQSMIDKLIIIETGRVPTEAQYFQFAHNLGIEDKIDRVSGRLKSGAILGPDARQRMIDEADEQMQINHDAYDEELSQAKDQAGAAGIDPNKTIRTGGYYNEVGKHLSARKAKALAAAAGTTPPAAHPQDDAMVKWAKENPDAPGAAEVLKANGL